MSTLKHCPALFLQTDGNRQICGRTGERAGTAGKQLLHLQQAGIHHGPVYRRLPLFMVRRRGFQEGVQQQEGLLPEAPESSAGRRVKNISVQRDAAVFTENLMRLQLEKYGAGPKRKSTGSRKNSTTGIATRPGAILRTRLYAASRRSWAGAIFK